jgi:hypothetical protein
MLRSGYGLTHRNELNSAGALRAHLAAIVFLFPLSMLKTAEQTPQGGHPTFFCILSSHSLMPKSCSTSASWCSHHIRS